MTRDDPGLPVVIAAGVTRFAVLLGVGYVRFLSRRKRGVREFRRTLERGGMPPDRAAQLAQAYHEAGSLRSVVSAASRSR